MAWGKPGVNAITSHFASHAIASNIASPAIASNLASALKNTMTNTVANTLRNIHVASTVASAGARYRSGHTQAQVGAYMAQNFQQLGPTYIKMGQFISSRNDIFGEDFAASFSRLRDQVPPVDRAEALKTVAGIKARHADAIQTIDVEPLATASIGQVHKARAKDGRELIVKFLRPGVKATIQADLTFLRCICNVAMALRVNHVDHMKVLLDDIERFLMQEVDFMREARNVYEFYKAYHDKAHTHPISGVVVPRIYSELCSDDVIVLEYVDGSSIDKFSGDRKASAKQLMTFFMYQMLENGAIHGDPHKGNIRIAADGKIVLYDYGNVIHIDKKQRYILKELVYTFIVGNTYSATNLLGQLGAEIMDQEAMLEYLEKYLQYIKTIDVSVFKDLNDPANRVPLRLSGTLLQLMRVYGILEGICKELDPEFNYYDLIDYHVNYILLDDAFLTYKMQRDMRTLEQRITRAVFNFFG